MPRLGSNRKFTRVQALIVAAGLWLVIVIAGAILSRLHLGGSYPFWTMLAVSGILGGLAGSFAFSKPSADRSPSSAILLLGFADIGLYQMLHGDSGGLILFLMMGGTAAGSLLASRLAYSEGPAQPRPDVTGQEN